MTIDPVFRFFQVSLPPLCEIILQKVYYNIRFDYFEDYIDTSEYPQKKILEISFYTYNFRE